MEIRKVLDFLKDLATREFYGTVQIEFRKGIPYLGLRTEKVLFHDNAQTQMTKESR